MMGKITRLALAIGILSLAPSTAALASQLGYAVEMSRARGINGNVVPEVVITIRAGQRNIGRANVQNYIMRSLRSAGVQPDLIEVQSVATAAIQFAADQDLGQQSFKFENWSARVSVQGGNQ